MSRESCPYCESNTFISSETKPFNEELISEENTVNRYWINKCIECSGFSINDAKDKVQIELSDASNIDSKWLEQ